ncbi:MAG: hypothetical protein R3A78_04755 [Polyangiales bacterium]
MRRSLRLTIVSALLASACSPAGGTGEPAALDSDNPFLDGEAHSSESKFDTGWVSSLNAVEVELDLEADIDPGSGYWDNKAPLRIGQFALTYLRTQSNPKVFVQSLAEDYTNGAESVEWLVGNEWKRGNDSSVPSARPTHFRLRGVNAVVLDPQVADDDLLDTSFKAIVPKRPSTLFTDAGDSCGTPEGDIDVAQSVYWYVWTPEKSSCDRDLLQTVELKVSKVLPRGGAVYPEYDKLMEDGRVDVVVFFGQVGHGAISESDYSFSLIRKFESFLQGANFRKAPDAPKGIRYVREQNGVRMLVDIYTPHEFSGLTDYANKSNFFEAVRSHEIVVWNGHSVLGASDFWANDEIYAGDAAERYQIFIYNGCLGYAYYVNPILEGKLSWDNVDLVTNAIETPFAIMVEETSATLGLIAGSVEGNGDASWQTILDKLNDISGRRGYYGASGVRTNAYTPEP